jgi:hypothetical protein
MSQWKTWKVLGVSTAYAIAALVVMTWLDVSRWRAAADAEIARGVGPNDDYIFGIDIPLWQFALVLLPPIPFLTWWLVVRRAK